MVSNRTRGILTLLFLCIISSSVFAQDRNSRVKLNQVGFYPESKKIAITPQTTRTDFHIRESETGILRYQGALSSSEQYSFSGENVKIADFSDFKNPGKYVLYIDGGSLSYEFEIRNQVFDSLASGLIKALYFNRVSVPLLAEHAGKWARAAGHPDTAVIIHPSAASDNRPAGSTISSPGGWYDAGDFNKYVVPISSSISHMLTAYEQFPGQYNSRDLNIPESGNSIPDILDEALFSLRWLLTMQDPGDGGVYNKLTHAGFQGTVMPAQATASRYVVQKGTTATLDFAAVMAQAARVYETFAPDFADSALAAARLAWDWYLENPNVAYNQDAMNSNYDPDISTGGYGDSNFSDERFWAGSELYITTGEDSFYVDNGWNNLGNSGWGNVQALGVFSLVNNRKNLTSVGLADTSAVKSALVNAFDWYVNDGNASAYRSPFGIAEWQFNWGSNGGAGNLGMGILMAYSITGNQKYYDGALDVLDYLLGRNAVDYSYVTGFGDQTPMHIHHRQSQSDGVTEPTPGWVAGGANPNNRTQDCGVGQYGPSSNLPALGYGDLYCSYSTNEITTYWNSPFIYLAAGLEHFTDDYSGTHSYPVTFLAPDNPDSLFVPGTEFPIQWIAGDQTENIDIYFKRFSDEDFTELATDVDASAETYTGFMIPDFPGDSLVFKFQDSGNPDFFAYSNILKIKPSRHIEFESIETQGDFTPDRRITIAWKYVSMDSIDIMYRLTSEAEFTVLESGYDVTKRFYNRFRVPDAVGDSLIFRLQDSDSDSVFVESEPIEIILMTDIENESEPNQYQLMQNYPNPFNPSTVISYQLAKGSKVTLKVFDLVGREVASLVDGRVSAGTHHVRFNAAGLSSGVYLYKLETPDFTQTRKMLLIK